MKFKPWPMMLSALALSGVGLMAHAAYPEKNIQYIIPFDKSPAFMKERSKDYMEAAKRMGLAK